jgi:uncharacterized membrane protein
MVVLAFDSDNGADQGRQKLIELNNQYMLNLIDAVEVVRHTDNKIKVKNIRNLTGVARWAALSGGLSLVSYSSCHSSGLS